MFSCVGETLPSAELCDDIDNDCDGARDEDCPCEAGATRACSDEFAVAPCMPGTQTCRGGTWSRCEGAIAPSADVCGDAIDNDCDGTVNEGCECVSTPEQCNDRIDNDCDGEVDEVTCAPLPDAGMSRPDAGVDAPSPDAGTTSSSCGNFTGAACTEVSIEVSDYQQQGYLALDSNGCEFAVFHTRILESGVEFYVDRYDTSGARLSRTLVETSRRIDTPTVYLTHGPSGFALFYGQRMSDSPYEMERKVAFLDASGALVRPPMTIGASLYAFYFSGNMFWNGSRWIAAWTEYTDSTSNYALHAATIDPTTGAFTVANFDYPGRLPQLQGALWTGDRFLIPVGAGPSQTDPEIHAYDGTFAPLGVTALPVGPVRWTTLTQGTSLQFAWEDPFTSAISMVTLGADLVPISAPVGLFSWPGGGGIGAIAQMLSLASEGSRFAAGTGGGNSTTDTYVRFGNASGLEPQADLRPYGALMPGLGSSASDSQAWVEVAPRRAVLWSNWRGTGWTSAHRSRLILLCDP